MTDAHRQLVQLAIAWARDHRFTAIATEVRLPHSALRADVAAYSPRSERGQAGKGNELGTTAVFECKRVRSDFLKDSHSRDATRERLQALNVRRQKLESLLKLHLPSLRAGETLFAEFDAVNLTGFEHKTYRRVLRDIEMLQRRAQGKTKFERLRKYRCANLNYLVAEPGILAPEETPVGWGVLVQRDSGDAVPPTGGTPSTASSGGLTLVREPVWQEANPLPLLQNIAAAATRQLLKDL